MSPLKLKDQSIVSRIGDILMLPLMYLLQMNISEVPQQTHYWNNTKMSSENIADFEADYMVTATGVEGAVKRWFGPLPIFHMPIIGGWSEFIVIDTVNQIDEWYVGWLLFDTIGISQISIKEKVRVLVGPRPVQFFGVDKNGGQIPIKISGRGKIGKAGDYSKIPLL